LSNPGRRDPRNIEKKTAGQKEATENLPILKFLGSILKKKADSYPDFWKKESAFLLNFSLGFAFSNPVA